MERDSKIDVTTASGNNFNSHAHVERDANSYNFVLNVADFNSHAHVERDLFN